MSLGGPTDAILNKAVNAAVATGVVVVVAAGNALEDACGYSPASATQAITVGAIESFLDMQSFYSNFGTCLDVWAPGSQIISTDRNGNCDSY